MNVQSKGAGIASMTGFAARESGDGKGHGWAWELRSVNGRGLDLRMRLPVGFGALEAPLRKRVSDTISRGSVTLSLRMTRDSGAGTPTIDPARLAAVLTQIAQIRAAAEAQGLPVAPVDPTAIMALRGLSDQVDGTALPPAEVILADVAPLIAAFDAMRRTEGQAIAAVLASQIDQIETLTTAAAAAAMARAEPQAARLRAAVAVLVDTGDLDEARLLQEVATLAVKTDVTEEIDRLKAHIGAARALLDLGGPVGRKLDFLMQEFNREANTLCSKAQDAGLAAIGLDLKLAIDQTREQVQNVE